VSTATAQLAWRARRGLDGEYPHGTRARYVTGCRCGECRGSNVRRYHERQAEAKAAAREVRSVSTRRLVALDDSRGRRVYKHACPGVAGRPCVGPCYLRKDSTGGICARCRETLIWNGLVPADGARAHVRKLGRLGIGYKSVGAACDVGHTILLLIRAGKRTRIRASTERRILGVDRGALADGALVPAAPTWRRIDKLLAEDFSRAEIARRLGFSSPALQFGRKRVTARTAARVERFYRRYME